MENGSQSSEAPPTAANDPTISSDAGRSSSKPSNPPPAKKLSKQEIKAARIDAILSCLSAVGDEAFPATVATVASRCEIPVKDTLTLLAGKPLKDDVILLAKDAESPVCLKTQTDRLRQSPKTESFFAERVRDSRVKAGRPVRQNLATFIKDAKIPTAIKTKWQADLKRRVSGGPDGGSLSEVLLSVIEPPLTIDQIASRLIQAISDAKGSVRYPVSKKELPALASIQVPTKEINAAMKSAKFNESIATCVGLSGKATDVAYATMQDVDAADPALVILAIEMGIDASRKKKGKSPAKPSTVFTAKKLAATLVKTPHQPRFIDALERSVAHGEVPEEVGCLMLDGANVFFRRQDVKPAQSTARPSPPATDHSSARPSSPDDFAAAFDAAFRSVDERTGRRNYVKLLDLRRELPQYSRESFDAGLRLLRIEGHYGTDTGHGGFVNLTDEERAAGIQEGNSLLIYVSRK